MMREEFERLTKIKVTPDEYKEIEEQYMATKLTKQDFCKQYNKKELLHKRYQRIVELENKLRKIEDLANKMKTQGELAQSNERDREILKKHGYNKSHPCYYPANRIGMGQQEIIDALYVLDIINGE